MTERRIRLRQSAHQPVTASEPYGRHHVLPLPARGLRTTTAAVTLKLLAAAVTIVTLGTPVTAMGAQGMSTADGELDGFSLTHLSRIGCPSYQVVRWAGRDPH